MQDRMRLYATLVIWAAFTIMSIVMFSSVIVKSASSFNDIIPLMGIVGGAAIVGTFSVWISARGSKSAATASSAASQVRAEQVKRKRLDRARMERLVSQMDADTLDELEDLLLERGAATEQQRGGYGR